MPSSKSYNRLLDEHLHILIAQGNHEAYLRLKKRYSRYADCLVRDILDQYQGTGISYGDLASLCDNRFSNIVKKYDPQRCSFFTYWKEMNEQAIMDYLNENSYLGNAKTFRGFIHLDDELDERRIVDDQIRETDKAFLSLKARKELQRLMHKNKEVFKTQDFAVLNLVLDGYSIAELEHAGLLSRSSLYLTFKCATQKLENIIKSRKEK